MLNGLCLRATACVYASRPGFTAGFTLNGRPSDYLIVGDESLLPTDPQARRMTLTPQALIEGRELDEAAARPTVDVWDTSTPFFFVNISEHADGERRGPAPI